MNRVWLVTGASSGFGRAITEAAVAADDTVIATARNAAVLSDIAAAYPGQVEALTLDVTDTAGIEAAVQDVIARHGRIDVLVNNAGRGHVGAAEETSDAELRSLFDVHVFGPAALIRAVLPQMRERRSGAIVQMSSMGGQMSFAGFSAYSGTKFALEGMSEALADEVRPLGDQGTHRGAGGVPHEVLRRDLRERADRRLLGHGRADTADGAGKRRPAAGRPGQGGGGHHRRY